MQTETYTKLTVCRPLSLEIQRSLEEVVEFAFYPISMDSFGGFLGPLFEICFALFSDKRLVQL